MYTFFLSLLVIDAILLCLVVLLQSGKGGGLSAEFGGASSSTDAFLGGRQTATLLTKASWWTGGIFLALALILTILSTQTQGPGSILEGEMTPGAPTQTQQGTPTPLLQQEQPGEAAGEAAGEGAGAEATEEGSPPGGDGG